ncbi:MAG: cell wall-active antibiotics response protein [Bacteroidales bacterium]|nr:cell wall-active antibiotics response protein [Bacteroidales bacterium]
MRNVFSSGLFWGLLLIVLGLLFFADSYWYFDINVFKVFVGIALVILGIWIMNSFKGSGYHKGESESSTIFSDADMQYVPGQQKYSVVFGSSTLDLSGINPQTDKMVELSCVFGEFHIKLNPETNFEIVSNAAFGSIRMPNHTKSPGVGSSSFNSPALDRSKAFTTIKIDVVFGEARINY